MPRIKVGDHVTWNSEAGYVSGKIIKVRTKDVDYRGYRKILIVCSLILLILACSRSLKQAGERTGPIDYGSFPTNYEQIIKDVINPSLAEPSSAIYNLSTPQKGRNTMNGDVVYGWNICGTVNSKSLFGEYAGPRPIYAMINNDKVIRLLFGDIIIPDSFEMRILSGVMTDSNSLEQYCKD